MKFADNWSSLPIDTSWIFYVATSNNKERIDEPLLSRFAVFDIPFPHADDLRKIVRNIYQGYRTSEPWGDSFQQTLGEDVVDTLEGRSPREIRRQLRAGFARAASQGRHQIKPQDIPAQAQRPSTKRIGFI